MNPSVARLARRVAVDPHFLAFALAEYAVAERLDDAALSAALGVSEEALPALRLCGSPPADPAGFKDGIDRIVAKFGANREVLTTAVRHGQAVAALRPAADPAPTEAGFLLAARDKAP